MCARHGSVGKAEKAREIIKKFPTLSKKHLGELLHKQNPIIFKDAEDGRSSIRTVTGSSGKKSKKEYIQSEDYIGKLKIPEGHINDFSQYVLKSKVIGLMSDIHFPAHNKKAIEIALKKFLEIKTDTIILNGDTLDCYALSSFDRDPTQDGIKKEIDLLCNFLYELREMFPKAKLIFKFGNHCERFERIMMKKVPELYGFACFELDNLIKIQYRALFNRDLVMDFVTRKRVIKAGHLSIIHGHEFGESVFSPVNAARGFFMRAMTSVIGGHQHQTSSHISRDLNGKITGAWSTGCLCDLNPRYRPINKWNLGFATVTLTGDDFVVNNYSIINNKIV